MSLKSITAPLALLVCLVSSASAHYLWVAVDAKTGEHGQANVYFEESPAPGDGFYLDPFVAEGKTWIRTVEEPQPKLVTTKEATRPKKRWLSGALPSGSPRSVESYGKFGVYRYGKTDVLLHYYARYLDVTAHEDLHELSRASHMRLDIVAHDFSDKMRLKVYWGEETVPDRTVYIRGPKGFRKTMKTDENGSVTFKIEGEGRYLFRTNIELDEAGKDGDKDYSLIRHHATLTMNLPLEK